MGKNENNTNITVKNNSKLVAIELVAQCPSITMKEVAEKTGVSKKIVDKWFTDPLFIDAWYKRYMEVAGSELPLVIGAMIREAKGGNVQAGRLILEHFGKLDTRVKIQVESPFEKFLSSTAEEAEFEFVEDEDVTNGAVSVASQASDLLGSMDELPARDSSNDKPRFRERVEKSRLDLATYSAKKKAVEQDNQREMYKRRKRAKAVGLELLGRGRKTKSQRDKWWKKLEELEIKKFGKIQE
tara:strand:- start:180 stop:902 length:723 start_codon:yes stop_codon:yes gene_type:complete